jgi:predicted nucleic acid-binding protein
MVLVDTSVWVSHLRKGSSRLQALLLDGTVVCHPFIIGELACGKIKNRTEILSLLQALPMLEVIEHSELLLFIERNRLMGIGLGLVDVHLLAAAMLAGISLWTYDRKLQQASAKLNIDLS